MKQISINLKNIDGEFNFIEKENYLNRILNKKPVETKRWLISENSFLSNKRSEGFENFKSYIDSITKDNLFISTKYMKEVMKHNFSRINKKDLRINNVLLSNGFITDVVKANNNSFIKSVVSIENFIDNKILMQNHLTALLNKLEQKRLKFIQEEEQYKVIEQEMKKRWLQEYVISRECPYCNETVMFPSMDVNQDVHQGFAFGIYSSVWNDMHDGIKFCRKCQSTSDKYDGWNIPMLKEDLKHFLEDKTEIAIEDDIKEFCGKYRFDKREKEIEKIEDAFKKVLSVAQWKKYRFIEGEGNFIVGLNI